MAVLTLSLFWMILTVLRSTNPILCRMLLSWDLCDVFLMIRLGLYFGEEDHGSKPPVSSHHIKGTHYPHDSSLLMLTLINQLGLCLSCFSTVKFLPPPISPFSMLYSLEESHSEKPTLLECEACCPTLRTKYLHELFEILLHGRYVSSPPFIYLFNH